MGFPFKEIGTILVEFTDRYDRINWGGCGVVAAILARHLTPFVDDIRIVTCGTDIEEARNNAQSNNIVDWENTGAVSFWHVWVEFRIGKKWFAIDSDGIRSRSYFRSRYGSVAKGSFTVEEMRELGDNPRGWNPAFRRDQVPSMKNILGRRFNNLFYEYI